MALDKFLDTIFFGPQPENAWLLENKLGRGFTRLIGRTNASHLQRRDFVNRPQETRRTPVVIVTTTQDDLTFESIVPAKRHAWSDIETNKTPPWVGLHVDKDGKQITMECSSDGSLRMTCNPELLTTLLPIDQRDKDKFVPDATGQLVFYVPDIRKLRQPTQDGIQGLVDRATNSIIKLR